MHVELSLQFIFNLVSAIASLSNNFSILRPESNYPSFIQDSLILC